jgi:hypothetical protein
VRKRRRILGASARPTRERTGVPHIDAAAVVEPVDDLLQKFDSGTHGRLLRPAPAAALEVRHAATGDKIPVAVIALPNKDQASPVNAQHELYLSPYGDRKDVVTLKPLADLCMPEHDWAIALRNVLTHELTHVVDPGLAKSKKRGSPDPRSDWCKYISDASTLEARLILTQRRLIGDREHDGVRGVGKLAW